MWEEVSIAVGVCLVKWGEGYADNRWRLLLVWKWRVQRAVMSFAVFTEHGSLLTVDICSLSWNEGFSVLWWVLSSSLSMGHCWPLTSAHWVEMKSSAGCDESCRLWWVWVAVDLKAGNLFSSSRCWLLFILKKNCDLHQLLVLLLKCRGSITPWLYYPT